MAALIKNGRTHFARQRPFGPKVEVTRRDRFDDATGAGPLQNITTQPEARVSYKAQFPDPLGRVIAEADYGTNGRAAWTAPSTIPASSATVLVASWLFDNAGNRTQSTDAMGTTTAFVFDQADRRVSLIENYRTSGSGPDINKTTNFVYNDEDGLISLTALNATTGNRLYFCLEPPSPLCRLLRAGRKRVLASIS